MIVVGTRAAQRTSIERKKRAATAMDSIAAEDVGKFPDQNVNEAISRVAGVALDRGDNGEGQGISVRGNGMESTRVDIDGMTVLNTNGALSSGVNAGTEAARPTCANCRPPSSRASTSSKARRRP